MTCTCEVVSHLAGPWDFAAAHPWFTLVLVVAVGWGVAQVVAAARRRP